MSVSLLELPRLKRARIIKVRVAEQHSLRLSELGIRAGANLAVVGKGGMGGVVINISGSRLGVDHRSAGWIEVEEIA